MDPSTIIIIEYLLLVDDGMHLRGPRGRFCIAAGYIPKYVAHLQILPLTYLVPT